MWDLSLSRSSETGVPAGSTRVSEDLGCRVLERRRGRINSRGFSCEFLLILKGFQFLGLVDLLVLARPECQLAGLVSPRDSVLTCLSNGEIGVTHVDFLADFFSESMDLYECWVDTCFGQRRGSLNYRPFPSRSFSKELSISGMYDYTRV